jgi:integrase/recombinase XerD
MTLEEYLQQRYSAVTVKRYRSEIETYRANCPGAETAFHKDITAYIGALRNRYRNAKTLNRILCSIKAYYDFLAYTGKRKDNPAASILLRDKQSRDIQLQDLFTEKELESLLEKKDAVSLLSTRNRVLTGLLIYQGLLPNELENLRVADINLTEGTIYIRGTAKTNSRTLPLKPTQIMTLHEYIHETRPKLNRKLTEEYLLIGLRSEYMRGADIGKHVIAGFRGKFTGRKVNCQTIRQSVITNLLKAGNDLRIVQVFAGHKYPSTTEKYKQTDTEALKTAIQNYHPIR